MYIYDEKYTGFIFILKNIQYSIFGMKFCVSFALNNRKLYQQNIIHILLKGYNYALQLKIGMLKTIMAH